jgi:hypothetical protein
MTVDYARKKEKGNNDTHVKEILQQQSLYVSDFVHYSALDVDEGVSIREREGAVTRGGRERLEKRWNERRRPSSPEKEAKNAQNPFYNSMNDQQHPHRSSVNVADSMEEYYGRYKRSVTDQDVSSSLNFNSEENKDAITVGRITSGRHRRSAMSRSRFQTRPNRRERQYSKSDPSYSAKRRHDDTSTSFKRSLEQKSYKNKNRKSWYSNKLVLAKGTPKKEMKKERKRNIGSPQRARHITPRPSGAKQGTINIAQSVKQSAGKILAGGDSTDGRHNAGSHFQRTPYSNYRVNQLRYVSNTDAAETYDILSQNVISGLSRGDNVSEDKNTDFQHNINDKKHRKPLKTSIGETEKRKMKTQRKAQIFTRNLEPVVRDAPTIPNTNTDYFQDQPGDSVSNYDTNDYGSYEYGDSANEHFDYEDMPGHFVVDRPFFFVVMDKQYKLVLSMGRVTNPVP